MSFFKRNKAEKSSEGDSPFLRARMEWLERMGVVAQQASTWRLVSFLAICGCLLSLTLNIVQIQQTKIIPYIVEVDKLGAAAAVRPLQDNGEVPRRLIQAEIVNVVTNWRTVTADLELQKKMLGKLAAYIGGSAKGTLREWFEVNNPYSRAEKLLVSVDVNAMPLPVSSNSWRVSWRETTRNHSGTTLDVTAYEATMSIAITAPKDEMQVMANPGGVIVTGISFGKQLN